MKRVYKIQIIVLMFTALITACAIPSQQGSSVRKINDADYPLVSNAAHNEAGLVCSDCHKEENKADYTSLIYKNCLDCHGSAQELAESTAHLGKTYNVHDSAHWGTEQACSTCHQAHKPTRNMCLSCHEQDKMKSLVVK